MACPAKIASVEAKSINATVVPTSGCARFSGWTQKKPSKPASATALTPTTRTRRLTKNGSDMIGER